LLDEIKQASVFDSGYRSLIASGVAQPLIGILRSSPRSPTDAASFPMSICPAASRERLHFFGQFAAKAVSEQRCVRHEPGTRSAAAPGQHRMPVLVLAAKNVLDAVGQILVDQHPT